MKSADLFCSDPSANTQQDRLHNLPNFVGGGIIIIIIIIIMRNFLKWPK